MPNSIRRWNGTSWGTVYSDILDTLTTAGDIAYRASTGLMQRLGVPTTYTDQVLGVVSGVPAWVEPTPAGTLRQTIKTTADAGWLLMGNGATVVVTNCEGLYPALFAAAPAGWISGTAPNRVVTLPDMANRMVVGAGTTAVGENGGAMTKTIATGNLPQHSHTDVYSSSVTDPTHNHTHSGGTGVGSYWTDGGGIAVPNSNAGTSFQANYNLTPTGNQTPVFRQSVSAAQTNNAVATGITVATTRSSTTLSGFVGTALDITPAVVGIVWQIKAH